MARHLCAAGLAVRGLTRDPGAAKAEPLREAGVELVAGDLTDRASLEAALEGVTGVFSMATPFEAGMDAEVAQGVTLGEAALAAGVEHYVYLSGGRRGPRQQGPPFRDQVEGGAATT